MKIEQTRDTLSETYLQSLKIRNLVFVKEQHVPLSLEIDKDEAYAIHFVFYLDNQTPVTTLRILFLKNEKKALIQRVATLKAYRKQGYAHQLLQYALTFLKTQEIELVELHAQLQAVQFYQKLGFEIFGKPFDDAGIQHLAMKKTLH